MQQRQEEANTLAFGIYTALEQYTVGLGIYSYWPKAGETGGFVLNPRCTISSTLILHKFLNECKVCYVRQSQWAFTCTPQMILNVAFKARSFEYAAEGKRRRRSRLCKWLQQAPALSSPPTSKLGPFTANTSPASKTQDTKEAKPCLCI